MQSVPCVYMSCTIELPLVKVLCHVHKTHICVCHTTHNLDVMSAEWVICWCLCWLLETVGHGMIPFPSYWHSALKKHLTPLLLYCMFQKLYCHIVTMYMTNTCRHFNRTLVVDSVTEALAVCCKVHDHCLGFQCTLWFWVSLEIFSFLTVCVSTHCSCCQPKQFLVIQCISLCSVGCYS